MASRTFAYIGNWDRWKRPVKDAFELFEMDTSSGELTRLGSSHPGISVGQTALDEQRAVLYCTDETSHHPDYFAGGGGRVFAFHINRTTGALSEVSNSPSYGSLPSAVAVLAERRLLVVTHHTDTAPVTRIVRGPGRDFHIDLVYDDATTVLFRLNDDGSVGELLDVHTWMGEGGPLPRQTHPRLHSISVAPNGAFFLVCDKGDDQVLTFSVDASDRLQVVAVHTSLPGSSPRYSAFHPDLPVVYVNHETRAVVETLAYDVGGRLESLGHVDSLPPGIRDPRETLQSDIRVTPDGKYVIQLIREVDLITVFRVDGTTGTLTRHQTVPTRGRDPRACAISPDGSHLLVACRLSNTIEIWAIGADGALEATGAVEASPAAGSVTFFRADR